MTLYRQVEGSIPSPSTIPRQGTADAAFPWHFALTMSKRAKPRLHLTFALAVSYNLALLRN